MNIRITDSARWQLRLTIQDLLRRRDGEASQLAQRVRGILANPILLRDSLSSIAGMDALPHREVILGTYHLFFRNDGNTLWFTGLWPPMYSG